MIGAGVVTQSITKQQDLAVDNTVRLARAGLASGKPMTETQADKVATDFEVLFVSQMLSQMFGESLGEDFFGSKETSDVYKSLVVEEYGKKMVENGGIGVADYVKKELLKLQEV